MNADTQRFGPRPALAFATAILLLVHAAPAPGQHYDVRNWHIEDGLPAARVTALAQTPDGYLWVGTLRGLARFDGVRFKVFTAGSSPGLGDSRIASLLTDREGTLWVGTLDGNLMRRQGNRFESARPPVPLPVDQEKKWLPEIVSPRCGTDLVADREGSLWWHVPGKGIARLKDGSWTVFTRTNRLPNWVNQLVCDREGRIWVEAGHKLYGFDSGRWDSAQQAVTVGGWGTPTMAPAVAGGLWVADLQGWNYPDPGRLHRLTGQQPDHPASFTTPRSIPPRTGVTALLEDRTGRLWVGTRDNGLCYFDAEGRWQHLEGQALLERGRISCLFEDRQDNLWVGTVEDGLHRLTPQPLIMLALPGTSPSVSALCATRDDAVWVGTANDGVLCGRGDRFTPVGGEWGTAAPPIQSLFEDSRTNLWAGTDRGLFRLEGGSFRRAQAPSELSRSVSVIFEDRTGCVWFGGYPVLACLREERFMVYQVTGDVRAIAEDGSGDLWIGTIKDGLFRLPHGQPRTVRRVKNYSANDIRSLFFDREGMLWVGGQQSGLFRRGAGALDKFVTSEGLPSDTIYSILSDTAGNLWMGSGNGIISLSPGSMKGYAGGENPPLFWQHLSLAQGLSNRRCYCKGQPGATRTSDGRLWFPNVDHLAVLDPAKALAQGAAHTVLVESVLADGKELAAAPGEALRASSGTRRFEFNYTALDLTRPRSLRFRYKLEGLDAEWAEAGGQRVAQYSRLPPGEYKFRVMAGGSDGQWLEAGRAFRLEVVPRLWERGWVQLLATGLLVGLVSGSVAWQQRRRLRLKLTRLEMERKVENERRRIARDLHDELGSRLTAIANLGELAVKRDLSAADMKSQLGVSNGRVRELIGAMDQVVWTVDPENDSLPNLAAFVSDYTERFVGPTGISHRLELDPEFPPLPVPSQSRHHLLLAVKEALSNAVRHAAPKTIRLRIYARDGWLEVKIADDGCGFEVDRARAGGHGLANLAERMRLINGQAEVSSRPGTGTTVTLSLPLSAPPEHN